MGDSYRLKQIIAEIFNSWEPDSVAPHHWTAHDIASVIALPLTGEYAVTVRSLALFGNAHIPMGLVLPHVLEMI